MKKKHKKAQIINKQLSEKKILISGMSREAMLFQVTVMPLADIEENLCNCKAGSTFQNERAEVPSYKITKQKKASESAK